MQTDEDTGLPLVTFQESGRESLGPRDVLIRFLAAPINPLDILVLADVYTTKPHHYLRGEPIMGYDGVGEIVLRGAAVSDVSPGDIVIPSKLGMGTWRTQAVVNVEWVHKIDQPSNNTFAAMMYSTVAPGFLLVEDMCNLRPGDWIIQNAATSAIAQMVVQFARLRNIHTIGIIRDRDVAEAESVKQTLHQLGSEIVLTESEVEGNAEIGSKPVKLALDCVSGTSARRLVDLLSTGGTFVQLGLVAERQGQLPLDATNRSGHTPTFKTFRSKPQMALKSREEQAHMFNGFVAQFNAGELVLPPLGLETILWNSREPEVSSERIVKAVKRAQSGRLGQRKQVMIFI
ncbi:GroES-like protein [Viridothelium virens]|uniref:enoyl-[acyl-carrier-protein] reductase n=1 Tax=Viridothelium virens TaxID=1048519 RepID=A0A6A6GVL7_VIRVR|nr:GroES-like protein [Viridothelium virens]